MTETSLQAAIRAPLPTPTLIAESVLLDHDGVRILDRRVFPFERNWVFCPDVEAVAEAIEAMVTQSSGPFFAASAAMVLAARSAVGQSPERRRAAMRAAGERLISTRRTNDQIAKVVRNVLAFVGDVSDHPDLPGEVERFVRGQWDAFYARSASLGRHAATLLNDGDVILTHCWAESYLTETINWAHQAGKTLSVFVTETRPYLQGARLTAESLAEMGVTTTLITDGMGAALFSSGEVDAMVTAADRVTMDGAVINKVGTLQLAVSAYQFGIPFFPLVQSPDRSTPHGADVPIEYRDGNEVLMALGHPTATRRVPGRYPAFDITPAKFITRIATDSGTYSPERIGDYPDGEADGG